LILKGTINDKRRFCTETYTTSKTTHNYGSKAAEPVIETQEQDRLPDSTHQEKIRHRAYEIYLERGKEPGRHLEDWLQAERGLTTGESKAAGAQRCVWTGPILSALLGSSVI
jgi:hypothetical protein